MSDLQTTFPGSDDGALVVVSDCVAGERRGVYEFVLTVRPVHRDGHWGDEQRLRIRAEPFDSVPRISYEPVVIPWHRIVADELP